MKTFVLSLLILLPLAASQQSFKSIEVADERPARRSNRLISYDNDFAWVGQDFGDSRDFGGNTKPGLFVHSKVHDRWLQILRVSTTGAKFGKSPEGARLQAPWDFTRLAQQESVELPILQTALHLPDRIVFDKERDAYLLYFDSQSETTTTLLVIPLPDLTSAFDHYAKRKQ